MPTSRASLAPDEGCGDARAIGVKATRLNTSHGTNEQRIRPASGASAISLAVPAAITLAVPAISSAISLAVPTPIR